MKVDGSGTGAGAVSAFAVWTSTNNPEGLGLSEAFVIWKLRMFIPSVKYEFKEKSGR